MDFQKCPRCLHSKNWLKGTSLTSSISFSCRIINVGPIPAVEYFFEFEEKKEGIRNPFLTWHAQQVAERVVYDFKEEMRKYCHSDVDILRRGFQKFREMFINLESADGTLRLGQDPLHYMTIAALAYDGVFRRSYLKPETTKYVARPSRQSYSADSIL